VASINPLGNRWTSVFDAARPGDCLGRSLGIRGTTQYDVAGRTQATIDPLGRRDTIIHDSAGRTLGHRKPAGRRAHVDLRRRRAANRLGKPAWASNDERAGRRRPNDRDGRFPRSPHVVHFRSRPISRSATEDALGRRTSIGFRPSGAGIGPALIHSAIGRPSSYDAAGQQVAMENSFGARTTTLYNAEGQVSASVNPLGARSSFVFDAAGRPVARDQSSGRASHESF
jgi:YD repeat-containing protein